jgi:hypothetical protein
MRMKLVLSVCFKDTVVDFHLSFMSQCVLVVCCFNEDSHSIVDDWVIVGMLIVDVTLISLVEVVQIPDSQDPVGDTWSMDHNDGDHKSNASLDNSH